MNMVPLGEFAEISAGNSAPQGQDDFSDEGIPFIRAGSLSNLLQGTTDHLELVATDDAKRLKLRLFPENSILFAKSGMSCTKGYVYRLPFEAHVVSHLAVVKPGPKLFPAYAEHALRFFSPVSLIKDESYPSIRLPEIAAHKIPVPPLEEQRRIAGILDQADTLRRLRTRALDKLNTLGQAIFHEMFGRSGGSENDVIDLGSMLTFVTSGGRGWAKYYSEEGARFLRSLDVQMNAIGDEDIAYVTAPDNAEARRTRVEKGDVLLTITGSKIGRSAALPDELEGSYISQHVAILRPDLDRVLPTFLSYFLSIEQFGQKQIKAKQYGQAKPGLNFEQIRSFQIPNVSIERQREFVGRLGDVAKAHSTSAKGKEKFEALFASLQNRAFRGQL